MPTPIQFIPATQVNTGTAATGFQSQPKTIGLSNGNILVVWDSDGSPVDPSPNFDIVGKIYDAQGNVVRDSFQLNTDFTARAERDPSVAATSDGGFILVYEDLSGASSAIRWERFDAAGDQTDSLTIASENTAGNTVFRDPAVAVDLTDNSSVVTYTFVNASGNVNILGRRIDENGNAGPPFNAAQNSPNRDDDSDVAVLSNGNYVSVYEETDLGTVGIEFRIFTPSGVAVRTFVQVETSSSRDPKVAALADGNFVVTWHLNGSNDVLARVYGPTGNAASTEFTVAGGGDIENEPDVVALPDGGFVIAWDNDTTGQLLARAYNADGSPDGAEVVITNDAPTQISVGVTADGRVLFTWWDESTFEIFGAIWDARGGQIDNTVYRQMVTNFVVNDGPVMGSMLDDTIMGSDGSEDIYGLEGNDTIYGGLGFDTIYGGTGFDTIYGGGGFDEINGEGGFDSINGNAGNDTIYGGAGNDTIDGGIGADSLNGGIGFDVIFGKGGNDTIAGLDGFDTLYGNNGDDSITGNAGNDVIYGGLGNDTIDGGIGADTLYGDAGADEISGKAGFDVIYGGNGNDTLYGNSGNDTLYGGLGNDTLFGGIGADTFVFNPTPGERDIIGDFTSGQDKVHLNVAPGASPPVQITGAAGGVEATVLGHTIFFAGLSLGQVNANDFDFI